MPDATLARRLAGPLFLRADTDRPERADERIGGVERFLRNWAGVLPPLRMRRAVIEGFGADIARHAQALRAMEDAGVARRFREAVARLKQAPGARQPLAEVFACAGEGARRALGMWPHPVQFCGARTLLTGRLAEMQTGEGKTLVAALAATVMAGAGAHVHVVSTNDYLAERDSEEMQPLFRFFGLEAGFIKGGMEADDRRTAYARPVCYAAGKEVVFDYLKDRLAGHGLLPGRVTRLQRLVGGRQADAPLIPALHFAIVDEADSVLIDEARTPMILSREAPGVHEPAVLQWAVQQARRLRRGLHFDLADARRDVELHDAALAHAQALPEGISAVWQVASWRALLLRQALTALHLYHRDQHYIVAEGKVQIVDESTGRVMADRSWEQGLHQLIETKEGLELTSGRETLVRMTFQRFFRRYFLLSGLTGTAVEAHRELWSVYRLKVCPIPPHRTSRRQRLDDLCWPDEAAKWRSVADDACRAAALGQPVLIGTRSVEASEKIAAELAARGVEHQVLNARQDAEEARIVSQAGQGGRITVATNMAGRGTDIKLRDAERRAGGLHVILTEFHESARVDRQLFGRSGRQGDPGTTRAIVTCGDELLGQEGGVLPALLRRLRPSVAQRLLLAACVRQAQRRAQRRAYRSRLLTLKQDRELSRLIGYAGKTI